MTTRHYELTILTGGGPDAGTTGVVHMKFDGTNGSTGWQRFADERQPHFRRGLVDVAAVECGDLGDVDTCSLLVERRGDSPAWFVRTVELTTGEESLVWTFETWVKGEPVSRSGPSREPGAGRVAAGRE